MSERAKIGMSTDYKTLSQLERGALAKLESGDSEKGPGRRFCALISVGRYSIHALVREALLLTEPVYLNRIAGLIFLPLLPPKYYAKRSMVR